MIDLHNGNTPDVISSRSQILLSSCMSICESEAGGFSLISLIPSVLSIKLVSTIVPI